MKITWNTDVNAPCCPGEIVAEDGRTVLIQTDWDYPGTASSFGWSIRNVQRYGRERNDFDYTAECGVYGCSCGCAWYPMELEPDEHCPECGEHCQRFTPCDHDATDGTVDCKECGLTASDFIGAAYDWLRDNNGAAADDPGYFTEN